jgi:hypothetical protein
MVRGPIPLFLFAVLFAAPGFSQQSYVSRYDAYGGYAFLDSPHVSLFENGFNAQFGVRPKTWVSVGVDYSITSGSATVTPNVLTTSLQQQVAAFLAELAAAGKLPPGYMLIVPAGSTTHSIAIGPQLAYRHFSKVTLFLRPSLGAFRETATPRPRDPIAAIIAQQLAPAGHKTDWQGFYGFGGGFDILFSKHVGWRVQSDLVWDHLFNDVIKDGRWTVRFSTGPCFNFGKNIKD